MIELQSRLQAVIDSGNLKNSTLVDYDEATYMVDIIKRLKIAESALANIKPETANQRQVLGSYQMLKDRLILK
tara:strand:+ start:1585 stop:1803 length:219 start_codon:yes stop_codon:yes gene_type:complete